MSTDKYNRAAYRKSVWAEAARLLRDRFFPIGAPSAPLYSDDVFKAPREVPDEIVQDVLLSLQKAQRFEDELMQRFRIAEVSDDQIHTLTGVETKDEVPSTHVAQGGTPKAGGGAGPKRGRPRGSGKRLA